MRALPLATDFKKGNAEREKGLDITCESVGHGDKIDVKMESATEVEGEMFRLCCQLSGRVQCRKMGARNDKLS